MVHRLVGSLTALVWMTSASSAQPATHDALTRVDPSFMVTAEEAAQWHRFKDQHGPALSGRDAEGGSTDRLQGSD